MNSRQPKGHAYVYPDSFCQCGAFFADPWREYDEHLLQIQSEQNGTSVMTPATVRRVPNAPKTPMHSFRCPDELWEAAKKKADEKGETLTEVLRKSLERYVKRG